MPRSLPRLSDSVFSPSDARLTPRMARFAREYVLNGGIQGAAAAAAGYAEAGKDTSAHRLMRNPLVQQEIMKETLKAIGLHAVPALATVARLASMAKSEYVQLEAAKDLLDRAGFAALTVDHRVDQSLVVTIDLGGSKTGSLLDVTPPDAGDFAPGSVGSPVAHLQPGVPVDNFVSDAEGSIKKPDSYAITTRKHRNLPETLLNSSPEELDASVAAPERARAPSGKAGSGE